MNDLAIHVENREAMGQRFVRAWHDAARAIEGERHLSFDSFATMIGLLTPKRLELLRALHRQPEASVAALARALDRDYKRVHADVEALTAAGLIERAGSELRAPYDMIQTTIAI